MHNSLPGRSRPFMPFFLLFLIIGTVYSPAIYFDYLHHDDVFFFFKLDENSLKHDFHAPAMIMGRYAAAWFIDLQGLFVHKVSDLRFLRFGAILILSCNAYLLFQQMRRFLWPDIQSFLVISALFFLPGFADCVSCSSTANVICSILLASWSFRIADEGKGLVIPSVVLMIALMFYQSGAMFYWVMVGMSILFVGDRFGPIFKKKLFRVTGIGLISLLGYALLVFFMSFFYSHKVYNTYNPYQITSNWPEKLNWFLHEPILNALNLWCIFPKWSTAFIVLGFIAVTVLIMCFRKLKQMRRHHGQDVVLTYLGQGGLFIFIFFLTFLPNFAALLNAPFYRCLIPLTSLIGLILVWAIMQWVKLVPMLIGRLILIGLLSIAVIDGGIETFKNVLYYRVLPSQVEWNSFRMMAESVSFGKKDSVYIICPDHFPGIERYDEFGVLTSQYLEDIFPLLISAFREEGRQGKAGLPLIYLSLSGEDRVIKMTEFIFKKTPDGKWFCKNIARDNVFHEFDPISVLGHTLPTDRGTFEAEQDMDAGILLKKYHPYVLDLREIFSRRNYYKLLTGSS